MSIDDKSFDRLVDDELSEKDRRELLGQLDDEPGGWRRCAMAFLEAQCWKSTLGEMANLRNSLSMALQSTRNAANETPIPQEKTPAVRLEKTRQTPWLGRAKILSAMAASFLAALWLGTAAHRAWMTQPPGAGNSAIQVADNSRSYQPLQALHDSATNYVGGPTRVHVHPNPWQMVTVSSSSDGQHPQSIRVPAVERENVDEQWLRSVPPAIPDNVRQALARTGHQIEQKRELMPVPLQDGRQLVVPVDRVNVRYVGNGPY